MSETPKHFFLKYLSQNIFSTHKSTILAFILEYTSQLDNNVNWFK